jgi:hypothetical protein
VDLSDNRLRGSRHLQIGCECGRRETIKVFTAEEGGAEHAHVDNRQVGIDFAADWLEANI